MKAKAIWIVVAGATADVFVTWFFHRLPGTLFVYGWPMWLLDLTLVPLSFVSAIPVGMAIGWAARVNGARLGALSFALGDVLFRIVDRTLISPDVWGPLELPSAFRGVLVAAVFGAVYGFAGEYLRLKRASNNAMQPTCADARG